jgi:predicted ATPase
VQMAYERLEAALALATEQGLAEWLPITMSEQGAQGQPETGIARMRHGIAAIQATRTRLSLPRLLARLAEAYGNSGQAEAGLGVLAEALAEVGATGGRLYEAELYRLKGELLLRQAVPDTPQAEACFQQALAVAHGQQARSWELRAAISLSRLWQRQGQRAAARALLAPIYNWFTEGFDTADLQEARVLLEELAMEGRQRASAAMLTGKEDGVADVSGESPE